MGNPWMEFLAEERLKAENKSIPPMELSRHVRPKYDAWKTMHTVGVTGMHKKKRKGKTMKKKMSLRGGKSRKR